jgi:acetyl esterase/lipase
MIRWLLLLFALSTLTFGLGTAFKPPSWINGVFGWSLAWLAGTYGHVLAALPLVAGVASWLLRRRHAAITAVTLIVCALAVVLLLKPAVQAWRLGRTLPGELAKAFGPESIDRAPFSPAALFARRPHKISVQTMNYSGPLKLDFYRPVGALSAAPCVIVLHGGGWSMGDRKEIRPLNDWLAGHGYAVAAIDYRLAPFTPWPSPIAALQRWFRPPHGDAAPPGAIWPAQLDDVRAALAFLRMHAAELGIDPTRFVLLGRSAGGQLAAAAAYTAHDAAIRGVVALYAPTDLRSVWERPADNDLIVVNRQFTRQYLGGSPADAAAAYDSASPLQLAGLGAPPTLLIHGQLDTFVWPSESQRLAGKLASLDVPHALVSLPWATHACEPEANSPAGQITSYALQWFLAAVTQYAKTGQTAMMGTRDLSLPAAGGINSVHSRVLHQLP